MPHTFTFTPGRSAPQQPLEVVLGSHTIKAYVTAPRDVYVMGIVRWGMEFGLLAKTHAGHYVRINGSQAQSLNHEDVEVALARASASGRGAPYALARNSREPGQDAGHASDLVRQAVVAVSRRKHRRIDPLLTSSGYLQ
jgi:hypothetical protein